MPATKTRKENKPVAKIGDDAVQRATGHTWDQWCALLDGAGCARMNHQQIVQVIAKKYGVGPWWQQMVTVGYEQARGLRQPHQKCDGDWSINASKTIDVPVAALFDAWNDARLRRRWLGARNDEGELVIRKATRPKSLRITWCDGRSNVDVNLLAKGDAKSSVQVEHAKLKNATEAAKHKRFWGAALGRLKQVLEG
jgi:uncharacterized protein YndB with AHSA1/START domain